MSDFLELLQQRTSAEHFDSTQPLSEAEIRSLVEGATQAPSSFNLQHWRFLAITDSDTKSRLTEATLPPNRRRITEAPLLLMILGDLDAHRNLAAMLDESVQAGVLEPQTAAIWLAAANGMYADPHLARDEAIRSCSLAGMILMLAAANRGYASCSVGFNPAQVKEVLSLSEHLVPVMMLVIGRPAPGNKGRRPRTPVDQVLAFDSERKFA